ncbi:ACT domain-containing protein ACR10, partial [Linum perenne]
PKPTQYPTLNIEISSESSPLTSQSSPGSESSPFTTSDILSSAASTDSSAASIFFTSIKKSFQLFIPTILCFPQRSFNRGEMGILHDDVVLVTQPDKQDDPTIITVNCSDKTGLGCDLCHIIFFFGLNIVRGDVSTDGKWCYIVFWVVDAGEVRWSLLKKRLIEACPSCSSASGISFYSTELQQKVPDVFLLKLCCFDQTGLLHGFLTEGDWTLE